MALQSALGLLRTALNAVCTTFEAGFSRPALDARGAAINLGFGDPAILTLDSPGLDPALQLAIGRLAALDRPIAPLRRFGGATRCQYLAFLSG